MSTFKVYYDGKRVFINRCFVNKVIPPLTYQELLRNSSKEREYIGLKSTNMFTAVDGRIEIIQFREVI
jgi:hypothetical protein